MFNLNNFNLNLDMLGPVPKVEKATPKENDKFFKDAQDDDVYGYVCSYLFEMPNGTNVNKWKRAICHQALPLTKCDGVCPNAMVTSLWYNTHYDWVKPMAERYWTWLLSQDSPYKKVTKDCEIIYRDNGEMCAVRLPNAGMVTGPELGNFCIATRWPREHRNYLSSWIDYVDAGFTGTQAMYLANHIWFDKDYGTTMDGPDAGHYPFNRALSWKKLSEATPTPVTKEPFYILPNYRPCNEIWDAPDGKKVDMYSKGMFTIFNPKAAYEGSFRNLYLAAQKRSRFEGGLKLPGKVDVIKTLKEAKHDEVFSG